MLMKLDERKFLHGGPRPLPWIKIDTYAHARSVCGS